MMNIVFLLLAFFAVIVISTISPVETYAYSQLPPVYQGIQFSFDKFSYTWGDQVYVRIISPISNENPNKPDVIKTTDIHPSEFEIDYSKAAILKDYSFFETGKDTGIFTGTFQIVKPGTNKAKEIILDEGYLEVDSSNEYIAILFDEHPNEFAGPIAHFTYPSDPTPPDSYLPDFSKPIPDIQFHWIESNSQEGGIGKILLEYPSKNISTETEDSFVIRLKTPYYFGISKYLNVTETGKNTGIFEGNIHVVSYQSPTKFTVTPNEPLPVSVEFPINDNFDDSDDYHFKLYASTDQQFFSQTSKNSITLRTDKNAYLFSQSISTYGKAAPNEELDMEISPRVPHGVQTNVIQYLHIQADSTGAFNATVKLSDKKTHSGEYALKIAGNKHDTLFEKHFVLTSLEDLRSGSVHIAPKQQSEMGLSGDEIVCKSVWKSVLKPGGKYPVCVKLPTVEKLLERGWILVN